jgi:hypothetical protein
MSRLERSSARLPLLLICALVMPMPVMAQEAPETPLPRGLYVAPCLRETVDAMMERSPTFRAQMEALTRARAIGVAIGLVASNTTSRPAEATMWRYESGLLLASIRIHAVSNKEELIAHEIEHVLEQVERVPLEALARSGDEAWRTGDAFETRRAIDAGRRVASEMRVRESVTASAAIRPSP